MHYFHRHALDLFLDLLNIFRYLLVILAKNVSWLRDENEQEKLICFFADLI